MWWCMRGLEGLRPRFGRDTSGSHGGCRFDCRSAGTNARLSSGLWSGRVGDDPCEAGRRGREGIFGARVEREAAGRRWLLYGRASLWVQATKEAVAEGREYTRDVGGFGGGVDGLTLVS